MHTNGWTLILTRELRANLKTFFAWAIPVGLLVAIAQSVQPSMAAPDSLLAAKLEVLPEGMKQAFGMTAGDLSRPASYLAVNFIYVTLTSTLFAGLLGASMLAKEELHHTAEALLSLPISRGAVFAGKLVATLALAAAYQLVMAAAGIGTLAAVVTGDLQLPLLVQVFAGAGLLSLTFGAIGLLVSTLVKEARSASGATLGIVLGTYLLGVMATLGGKAEKAGVISPYKLVEPGDIVAADGLEGVKVAALVAIGVAAASAAFVRFSRRDIHA